jgi:hypothetical protein
MSQDYASGIRSEELMQHNWQRPGAIALALFCAVTAQTSFAAEQEGETLLKPTVLPEEPTEAEEPTVLVHDGAVVYMPASFTQFAPRTALDMLQNVPGFSIDGGGGGNNRGRGLGQASGNVLINGTRLTSKSEGVTDQLQRIPASQVIRIEIGESSNFDVPGLSGRIANVVVESSGGTNLQFEWRPQLAAEYSKARWMEGIISLSGTSGRLEYTVAAEGRPFYGGSGGPNIFTFGDGRQEERFAVNITQGDDTRYSSSLRYNFPGGMVANLSGSLLLRRFRGLDDEQVVEPGLPPALEAIRFRNKGYDYDIGGDVTFGLGPGQLKLIGLERYSNVNNRSQSNYDPATGAPETGTQFTRSTQTGERIGRFEYDWPMLGGDWQLSGEAAFNRLDRSSGLFFLNTAGDFVEIPFPSGTGGVTESRYEALLSYGRPLTDRLSMQLILGGESSRISQTGNNALQRKFVRPKGSLVFSWAADDGLDISFKIERRVGQLSFGDFLAEVNLGDNNQNDGNNQLRPDQRWQFDLELAKDLGQWGSMTLRYFDRRITDYVAIVPSPNGGSATGNIASAFIQGLELSGTVRLDPIGIPGARLDLEAQLRKSGFEDPVEGGTIPVQFARPYGLDFDFRHDIPESNWAWGAGIRTQGENLYYRVEEYGYDYNIDTNLNVFVEHKDVFGLTVQARLNNILEREIVLDRYVFDGPRGSSPLLFRENRRREVGKVINFVVKGSF